MEKDEIVNWQRNPVTAEVRKEFESVRDRNFKEMKSACRTSSDPMVRASYVAWDAMCAVVEDLGGKAW